MFFLTRVQGIQLAENRLLQRVEPIETVGFNKTVTFRYG